jgi:hypothetical protein
VASSIFEIDGSLFNLDVAVLKLDVFPWEVVSFEFETHAYSWIDGCGIGPRFLAHVITGGVTVIGFVMEKMNGRHATPEDLPACRSTLSRLHQLGVLHRDTNPFNFIVNASVDAILIDYECATHSQDKKELD